ncbi:P-loop containing nucleoside triphosphate hydrolase protein [Podospora fimiseda]|uniref:P-loop containing nucleoside triphosphate hydrolase protein n=1 Tax=Podospora fimiseda TaxID=252190 RepID=A0AAN7BNV3_9PEZI|nr:P-loop containing nucleoside triphosphate hydrolase protein [Podospora fimiseda]
MDSPPPKTTTSKPSADEIDERYHALHGRDISSFDLLESTHRLPTVSAADALEEGEGDDSSKYISTGLKGLDGVLSGGVEKGTVVEVWGPPGVGKTGFGMQLTASCLKTGEGVVWVDGFHRMSMERLKWILEESSDTEEKFRHFTCPSLAHLIALLCRPTGECIPEGTGLVVVDSLSALVNHAFPRIPQDGGGGGKEVKGKKAPPMAVRRVQVLQYIVSSFQKLAATRNLTIVNLTQCATKIQAERGATLVPAINATAWEQGMTTRLVLFRDWAVGDNHESRSTHFVGVQKMNGKAVEEGIEYVFAFRIKSTGLVPVEYDNTQQSRNVSLTPAQKRKLGDTDFEIADSEEDDEDYGWDESPDAIPPMPSQWQGSEDILLVRQPESDEEEVVEQPDEEADAGAEDNQDPGDKDKL